MYDVHQVGGRIHLEYWIPAEDLDGFNEAIVGKIEVVATYRAEGSIDGPRMKDLGVD